MASRVAHVASISAERKILLAAAAEHESFNHMVNYRAADLDLTFAALADPTRRRIIQQLTAGETRVTELAEPFRISLPAISKHLRVLERAGLLRRRRAGREHRLQLNPEPMQAAAQWIEHYRHFWEGSLDRLADFVESKPSPKSSNKASR